MTGDPRRLELTPEILQKSFQYFIKNPREMFFSRAIRQGVAALRARNFGPAEDIGQVPGDAVEVVLDHNRRVMSNFVEAPMSRMLMPLAGIDPFYGDNAGRKVLSVGCRNEMELFLLYALGFEIENITAIDLVRNSPLVTLMDMHRMSFEDSSFDLVSCGWVLPYSGNPGGAAAEMLRVLKPGGVLAIGLTRIPETMPEYAQTEADGGSNFLSWRDLQAILPDVTPIVTHDPVDTSRKGHIIFIGRKG